MPPGGRMNAPGIPVFYGATDMDTCVTEVRPPVGSYVVAARFEMLRTLRLLDLDALEWVYVKEGYFDPEFTNRRSKALFLQWLAKEISRPVMPRDEAVEYLATQAMAEYLANRPEQRLDGIVFRSSQTSGTGHNVVLFNHARRVTPHVPPDPPAQVSPIGKVGGHGVYLNLTNDTSPDAEDEEHHDAWSCDKPTLRLDVENVVVLNITGVKYESNSRHR